MKRMYPIHVSLILFFLFSTLINAQSNVEPPSPLYRNNIKEDINLTIKYTYKAPPAQDDKGQTIHAPNLEKKTILQTGNSRQTTLFFDDHTTLTSWLYGSMQLSTSTGDPNDITISQRITNPDNNNQSSDFPELSWISRASFRGTKTIANNNCYFYQSGDMNALIDQTTLLPISFESKLMTISYTYATPPSEPIQLPKKCLRAIENARRASVGQLPLPPEKN